MPKSRADQVAEATAGAQPAPEPVQDAAREGFSRAVAGTTPSSTSLEKIPEDLRAHAGVGTEAIGKDDIRPPRLALAQAMSPQVKRSDPKYIQGLMEGMLFNDLTGEIYTQDPKDTVRIVVVSMMGARGVEFAPQEEGGHVIDGDVPLDDPRMQFTDDPKDPKKRVRPIATKFYDYLLWLTDRQEFMTFSMKGTQIKVAIKLNSLLKQPLRIESSMLMQPPAWARTFLLGTVPETDGNYNWTNFTIRPDGVTPPEVRQICADLHSIYAKKNIVIEREREPGSDDGPLATDM
jgi:hypothetical protein